MEQPREPGDESEEPAMGDAGAESDRWRTVDDVFGRALDLPETERASFLDEACAGQPELRREVEELLAAAEAGDEALEATRRTVDRLLPEAILSSTGERRVGHWRLLEELGRGGMGTVYLAERADGAFEQRAALKLLRPELRHPEFRARFVAERQILASLSHPNIARLLDGGTSAGGRPFLALEYVDGRPITTYCESEGLALTDRLRLFVTVARAVQYAHRSLVVHRDLKPSNVLVTSEGRVKLLDFGIAKLLGDSRIPSPAPPTRTGSRMLTPEYASPEQVRGEPVTTASDVYQLGLLLYEMLTGTRPYAPAGPSLAALERAICHTAPTPPSQALGDRAGAEAATGPSASEGSSPPLTVARAKRLKGDLDNILLVALRKEPERRYASAEQLAEDVERHLSGLPVLARADSRRYRAAKFLSRNRWPLTAALAGLFALGGYAITLRVHAAQLRAERDRAEVAAEKASRVQDFLLDVFRKPDPFQNPDVKWGDTMTLREALDLGRQRALADTGAEPAVRAALLSAMSRVYDNLEARQEAERLGRMALQAHRQLSGEESPEAAEDLLQLGGVEWTMGRSDSAVKHLREYLVIARKRYGPRSGEVGHALGLLSRVYKDSGALERSLTLGDSAVGVLRSAGPERRDWLAAALEGLAQTYTELGQPARAEPLAREALAVRQEELGPDDPQIGVELTTLASALDNQGKKEEAAAANRRALAIFRSRLGPTHDYTLHTLNNLAFQVPDSEAVGIFEELIATYREKEGPQSENGADAMQNLSTRLHRLGRDGEAETWARRAHDAYREALGPNRARTAYPLLTLARIELGRGAYAAADSSARQALAILGRALPPGHYVRVMARSFRGRALAGLGRWKEAEPILEDALRALEDSQLDTRAERRRIVDVLASHYESSGRSGEARRLRASLTEPDSTDPSSSS